MRSGGARSRNLGGGRHLRGNTHLGGGGGQDRISRNLPSPSLPKFLTPWIFFHTFFPKFFPGLPKFFTDLPKIFPRPSKNVIFLATFHKFLQFCLSNSGVSTTFGHFSQKSPLCWCGSYTHGSQRLMASTEIIKNWGGGGWAKWGGGEKIIWGLTPPLWMREKMTSHISFNLLPLKDEYLDKILRNWKRLEGV